MKKIIDDIYIYIYTKSTNYREEVLLFRTSSQYRMRGEWYSLVRSSGDVYV